jgi:RimJ/RimL family protein N-acetyltransferase
VIRFYRRAAEALDDGAPGWPGQCELRTWRPACDGFPRWTPDAAENLAWFAFDRLGLFASREFEAMSVWRDGRLLHRMIVTPRWLRFPFMAEDDLQVGAIWTSPEARRLGLARAAIHEAHRRHAAPGRWFWYVADDENAASIALAEACGYRLAGEGRRTRPLGVRGLGRFRLDAPTIPKAP